MKSGVHTCYFCADGRDKGVRPHNGTSCSGCGMPLSECKRRQPPTLPKRPCPVCTSKVVSFTDDGATLRCGACRTLFQPVLPVDALLPLNTKARG